MAEECFVPLPLTLTHSHTHTCTHTHSLTTTATVTTIPTFITAITSLDPNASRSLDFLLSDLTHTVWRLLPGELCFLLFENMQLLSYSLFCYIAVPSSFLPRKGLQQCTSCPQDRETAFEVRSGEDTTASIR